MDKLPVCRICLMENIRMYEVVNKSLQELYEKLTDAPFVTEDRPMLACFFCYSKLKLCWRLQRKCLQAEELFTQMLNEDYEMKPVLNQGLSDFLNGFVITPPIYINIDDNFEEDVDIKEKLPADGEGQDKIMELNEEHQSDAEEPQGLDSYTEQVDIPAHQTEVDSEDEATLMEFKIDVDEDDILKEETSARSTDILIAIQIMEEVKKPSYKYCMVPDCKNTTISTPDRVFFRIPRDAKLRKQWCKMMRRNNVSPLSVLFCCEDHFNVKEDTVNYIQYNIMKEKGRKCSLRLKKGVIPHIFLCQKRNMPPPVERTAVVKRQRLALVNEALSEYAIKNSNILKIGKPPQRSGYEAGPSTSHANVCR